MKAWIDLHQMTETEMNEEITAKNEKIKSLEKEKIQLTNETKDLQTKIVAHEMFETQLKKKIFPKVHAVRNLQNEKTQLLNDLKAPQEQIKEHIINDKKQREEIN
eukprot:CAMPEP_0116009180 /NCGR_PEP_ID=MMETSP0321-20121206/3287_1 /TAXON_ID=163516 /ORGANISM="Leptocylindrus danicus var. danicus, Strain B650" /LENGTH=104 /DNA_ID=CAMNT_0003478109 /DNA_START=88 /DNA_END=402 /DNA_ORIENTATION=-